MLDSVLAIAWKAVGPRLHDERPMYERMERRGKQVQRDHAPASPISLPDGVRVWGGQVRREDNW